MSKPVGWIAAFAALVMAAALTIVAYQVVRDRATPISAAEYHAVLLSNGQAFFGRLSNAGSTHPVLVDVFYIQSRVNPETKEVSNVLVKRGKEWHAPDRMLLNRQTILLIEPVNADSQVAKLIAEQMKQQN